MQRETNHSLHSLKTACIISVIVLVCCALGCGTKVVRTYGQEGELKELLFKDREGIQQVITFTHNRQQRMLMIEQKNQITQNKVMEMKVRYTPDGRISFIAKKTFAREPSKTEAEYDSFSYAKSGEVTKVETSYKSAYSISKHNTALITAQYKYQSGILAEIMENGGTFKRIIKPVYSGEDLKALEYSMYVFQPKKQTFEKTKDLYFHFSNGAVRKATDRQLKKEYGRSDAIKVFVKENAGYALGKIKYGTTISVFLKNAESYLIESN